MKYPKRFLDLIDDFKKLPGIGKKTAERLALHVITKMDDDSISLFSENLNEIKNEISHCPVCGVLSDGNCPICTDLLRDKNTIMVLSEVKDVFVLERTQIYHGLYHILGGSIDFSRGILPEALNIDSLFKRLDNVDEIILSLNGTVEGELTASYIKELLKDSEVKVTRIAYGIPVGADLSYADDQTIFRAIENRRKYE
ncbi:MAG TPA: recombination mediator RecR [Acholeplasma sp.]|nr:recombination mediator RecR [Acholeplasma sp.]